MIVNSQARKHKPIKVQLIFYAPFNKAQIKAECKISNKYDKVHQQNFKKKE